MVNSESYLGYELVVYRVYGLCVLTTSTCLHGVEGGWGIKYPHTPLDPLLPSIVPTQSWSHICSLS